MKLTLIFTILFFTLNLLYSQTNSLIPEFEECYQEWVKNKNELYFMMPVPYGGEEVDRKFRSFGPTIVPLLIEKMEKDIKENYGLNVYVIYHTKKLLENENNKHDRLEKRYIQWWKEGRKRTPEILNNLFNEYKIHEGKRNKLSANQIMIKIKRHGFDALAYLIEKIRGGDASFIPTLKQITFKPNSENNLKNNPNIEECLSWWEINKDRFLLPPVK